MATLLELSVQWCLRDLRLDHQTLLQTRGALFLLPSPSLWSVSDFSSMQRFVMQVTHYPPQFVTNESYSKLNEIKHTKVD